MTKPVSTRVHYVVAVVDGLRAHGGHSCPSGIYDWLISQGLRRSVIAPDGVTPEQHFQRDVRFARQELKEAGWLITQAGAWTLTNLASASGMTIEQARQLMRENARRRRAKAKAIHPKHRSLGPSKGPPPSTWQGIVARGESAAFTYVFRFAQTDVWKVGYAINVDNRLHDVNLHLPIEVIEWSWEVFLVEPWPTRKQAYAMEQEALRLLQDYRTRLERFQCSAETVSLVWRQARERTAMDESSESNWQP